MDLTLGGPAGPQAVPLCKSVCDMGKGHVARFLLCSAEAPQVLNSLQRLSPSQLRPECFHSSRVSQHTAEGPSIPVRLCCERQAASCRQGLTAGSPCGRDTPAKTRLGSFVVEEVGAFDCKCSGDRCHCQNVKRTVCDCRGGGTNASTSSSSGIDSSPSPSPDLSPPGVSASGSNGRVGPCRCGRWQRQCQERINSPAHGLLPGRHQVVRETLRWLEYSEEKGGFRAGNYKMYSYYIEELEGPSGALSTQLTPELERWVERFVWRRREGPSQRPSRLTLCQAFFDPPRAGPRVKERAVKGGARGSRGRSCSQEASPEVPEPSLGGKQARDRVLLSDESAAGAGRSREVIAKRKADHMQDTDEVPPLLGLPQRGGGFNLNMAAHDWAVAGSPCISSMKFARPSSPMHNGRAPARAESPTTTGQVPRPQLLVPRPASAQMECPAGRGAAASTGTATRGTPGGPGELATSPCECFEVERWCRLIANAKREIMKLGEEGGAVGGAEGRMLLRCLGVVSLLSPSIFAGHSMNVTL